MSRGFLAGAKEKENHRDQLVFTQPSPVDLSFAERGNKTVRLGALTGP